MFFQISSFVEVSNKRQGNVTWMYLKKYVDVSGHRSPEFQVVARTSTLVYKFSALPTSTALELHRKCLEFLLAPKIFLQGFALRLVLISMTAFHASFSFMLVLCEHIFQDLRYCYHIVSIVESLCIFLYKMRASSGCMRLFWFPFSDEGKLGISYEKCADFTWASGSFSSFFSS